jgi:hypothetical protein
MGDDFKEKQQGCKEDYIEAFSKPKPQSRYELADEAGHQEKRGFECEDFSRSILEVQEYSDGGDIDLNSACWVLAC